MPKKRFASSSESHPEASSVLRRTVMVGIILAILAGTAGLAGYLTRSEAPQTSPKSGTHTTAPKPHSTLAPDKKSPVAQPPRTSDPVAFAKAATKALWTYDTRHVSRSQHLAGLKPWMTDEQRSRDWKSVTEQVPGEALWPRLHANAQHAAAQVAEGHLPEAFKDAMSQDPGGLSQAYVYAVTTSGKQSLAWKHGGSGADPRQVTLAVQCRPHHDCALAGVLPEVAP